MSGALVYKNNANQSIPNAVNTQLTLNAIEYDTDGFFNLVTSRFVIPAGVSKVRLKAQAIWRNNGTGFRQLVIKKNFINGDLSSGWFIGVPAVTITANPYTTTDLSTSTPIINVVEGDNFLVEVYQVSGGALDVLKAVGTWFEIEVIE